MEGEGADWGVGGAQGGAIVVVGVEEPARAMSAMRDEEKKSGTHLRKNCATKSLAPSLSKNPLVGSTGKTTGSRFAAFAFSLLTREERPGPSRTPESGRAEKAIDGSKGF